MFLSEAGDKAPVNLDHSVDKVRVNSRGKKKNEQSIKLNLAPSSALSCAALGAQHNHRELYFAPGK